MSARVEVREVGGAMPYGLVIIRFGRESDTGARFPTREAAEAAVPEVRRAARETFRT